MAKKEELQAIELMIGNYVFDKEGAVSIVKEIYIENVYFSSYCLFLRSKNEGNDVDIQEVKPIPLTEQWLIDFGFERKLSDSMNASYFKNPITLSFAKWRPELNWSMSISVMHLHNKSFRWVHELQNLYFTLTNKQLTKKENVQS